MSSFHANISKVDGTVVFCILQQFLSAREKKITYKFSVRQPV